MKISMSELTFSGLTFFHDKYRSGQKVERGSFLNIEFQKTEDPKSPQRGLRHRLFKETFQNNFPVEESISGTNRNVFKTKLKHLIWSFTYSSDLHFSILSQSLLVKALNHIIILL